MSDILTRYRRVAEAGKDMQLNRRFIHFRGTLSGVNTKRTECFVLHACSTGSSKEVDASTLTKSKITVPLSAFGIEYLFNAFDERKRKFLCSLAEM
jgi:hypothetical protein